jgi:hypothetical protein
MERLTKRFFYETSGGHQAQWTYDAHSVIKDFSGAQRLKGDSNTDGWLKPDFVKEI